MTNINVDPGTDGDLNDIVRGTERGVILDGDKSWSVAPTANSSTLPPISAGWWKDGEVKGVLKNTYKGDTLKFYNSLSAVGDERTWQVMCEAG